MSPKFAEVFKKNYLVTGLDDRAVGEIAELAEVGSAMAGACLIEKGDDSSDLFVILDGTVHVYTKQGNKLGECGPGSVLGEVALVDAGPRSANVMCLGVVTYAKLPAADLRRYMTENKEAGFMMLCNLSRVLSMRLRSSAEVMEDLRAQTVDPWEHAL
ncbi:MAG: cyclic nucleotide-binding domain-containing protein [Armatimonadetes bacterium]|nr:cyclic nucleotide-binding domain-containing protein [Armatimonadota bacterium]